MNPLLESIRRALTEGPQTTETVVFVVSMVTFALLIIVAGRLFAHDRGPAVEPQVDYLTLAVDVLGLSESDRLDLQKVARQAGLEQPVAMLLSPANLARAAAAALAVETRGELRQQLERLCLRLFEVPLPDPERLARRST